MPSQVGQTSQVVLRAKNHAAAIAAITAIGTATRDVGLTPEAASSVAALSCVTTDMHSIDKHGDSVTSSRNCHPVTENPMGSGCNPGV